MSYWDSANRRIVHISPRPWDNYPGWLMVDCGCCAGVRWGGEIPEECDRCGGSGRIAQHIKSGKYAHYPGGPFC